MKLSIVSFVLCFMFLANAVTAEVPSRISYQARLTDNTGAPVPDSTYSMTFRITDAESGGNVIWSEVREVTTLNGLITVDLGAINPILPAMFETIPRYLEVEVDDETLNHNPILTTTYAIRTATADLATAVVDNGIDSMAIADGSISLVDIGPGNALEGQVLKWSNSQWGPAPDDISNATLPDLVWVRDTITVVETADVNSGEIKLNKGVQLPAGSVKSFFRVFFDLALTDLQSCGQQDYDITLQTSSGDTIGVWDSFDPMDGACYLMFYVNPRDPSTVNGLVLAGGGTVRNAVPFDRSAPIELELHVQATGGCVLEIIVRSFVVSYES